MKTVWVFGMTLGLSAISPVAQAAQLTLNFDAFIPTPRVVNPVADVLPPFFTEFIGDDRGFDLAATQNGQARLFTEVILDTEAADPLASSVTSGGTTVGFLLQDGVETSQSAEATAISSVTATRLSENQFSLEVAASATNPLIDRFVPPGTVVPPAEYLYDITLTLLDDGIAYDLVGTNRQFPSYSVFLNETPILLNPANGNDSNLLAEVEPVSASGIVISSNATSVNEPAMLVGLLGLLATGLLRQRSKQKAQTMSA